MFLYTYWLVHSGCHFSRQVPPEGIPKKLATEFANDMAFQHIPQSIIRNMDLSM